MIEGKSFDNGYNCAKIGKSIHYNPFRNTKVKEDKEENAYKKWIEGWNAYHTEQGEKCENSI